jgi:hypothetical protein
MHIPAGRPAVDTLRVGLHVGPVLDGITGVEGAVLRITNPADDLLVLFGCVLGDLAPEGQSVDSSPAPVKRSAVVVLAAAGEAKNRVCLGHYPKLRPVGRRVRSMRA